MDRDKMLKIATAVGLPDSIWSHPGVKQAVQMAYQLGASECEIGAGKLISNAQAETQRVNH